MIDLAQFVMACPKCFGHKFLKTGDDDGDPIGHLACLNCGLKITVQAMNQFNRARAEAIASGVAGDGIKRDA